MELEEKHRVIHDITLPDHFTNEQWDGGSRVDHKRVGRCFSVSSFLSPKECEYFVTESNKIGLEDLSSEYEPKYRNSKRLLLRSKALANCLYSRLIQHFKESDVQHERPYGFYNIGSWKPVGLNDVFKVSCYEHDAHFRPHFDGCFVVTERCRSVYTLLIYLNSEFTGGETIFYGTLGERYAKPTTVQPTTGASLVFKHDLKHEGVMVTSGKKYIIKTEVLFRRLDRAFPLKLEFSVLHGDAYFQAKKLYELSDTLEKMGDVVGSTEAYLRGQNLQLQVRADPAQRTEITENGPPIAHAVYQMISRYLSLRDQINCSQVCYSWYTMATADGVWRQNFVARFPKLFGIECQLNKTANQGDKAFLRDWLSLYKRVHLSNSSKKYKPVCIDLGSNFITVAGFDGPVFRDFTLIARETHPHFVIDSDSFLGAWRFGSELKRGGILLENMAPYSDGKVVDWAALYLYLTYAFNPQKKGSTYKPQHPILFAEGRIPLERPHLYYTMFMLFEAPAVCIESSAVLALGCYGRTTGYVVDCGNTETVLSPVVDGVVLKEFERVYPIGGRLLADLMLAIAPYHSIEYWYGEVMQKCGAVFLDYKRGAAKHLDNLKRNGYGRAENELALKAMESFFNPSAFGELASQQVVEGGMGISRTRRAVSQFPQEAINNPFVKFVYASIMECEERHRTEFFNHIVLCGGLAAVKGFKERFEQDFRKERADFRVLTTNAPHTVVVAGARQYALSSNFRAKCITREEYISKRLVENPKAFYDLGVPELTTTTIRNISKLKTKNTNSTIDK